jgi:predicted RNase H-like HicB family nuclease
MVAGGAMARQTVQLTAVIERDGDVYVATCPELDIASQGDSVDEARANLIEALEGFFAAASEAEIRESLPDEILIEKLELAVG